MTAIRERGGARATATGGVHWRNWAQTVSAHPVEVRRPASVGEIQESVVEAASRGLTVKTVGAGHSFTPLAAGSGIMLDIAAVDGVLDVDVARKRVTLAAGTNLHQLPGLLAPYGLAPANLGDIDRQTIAGAVSTGTHGTGRAFTGLAGTVVGATLVTAEGALLVVDEHRNSELLPAVALGLGALGVLVSVTIQCVDAFDLHALERPEPMDAVLDDLLDRWSAADHYEFHWFPGTGLVCAKENTRVPAGASTDGSRGVGPRGRVSRWLSEELLGNGIWTGLMHAERMLPPLTTPVSAIAARVFANGEFVEDSHSVFTAPRRVRFREMEYALPIEEVPDAMREIRTLLKAHREWRIEFPIEVRSAAADNVWMSTANGRETGYIAVHRWFRRDVKPYFAAVERIMVRRGGRPHWGKMHTREAAYLRTVYPHFDDFVAMRNALDPARRFANPHLTALLGA